MRAPLSLLSLRVATIAHTHNFPRCSTGSNLSDLFTETTGLEMTWQVVVGIVAAVLGCCLVRVLSTSTLRPFILLLREIHVFGQMLCTRGGPRTFQPIDAPRCAHTLSRSWRLHVVMYCIQSHKTCTQRNLPRHLV
jgi:hypothetical protein